MEVIILVLHILLALSLIGIILLQPPENSSLGGLGGSNAMSGFSARGQGNILTRATAIIAALFIITSLTLAIISGANKPHKDSILDEAPNIGSESKAAPAVPAAPETPAVPLAK
jgi:preprotein translocase subunit SecG